MVSTFSLQEKYNQVRRNFCFYLDIQDNGVSRTLSKRIEDLGLQQEVFLTERVTHVVRDCLAPAPARWLPRDGARSRADAMLQRVRKDPEPRQPVHAHNFTTLNVQKAIILLDKIYDTFFTAPRKANVRVFKKHYIKIEFLDKVCRPVYKEFDEWPEIPLDPDPPKKLESSKQDINQNLQNIPAGQKMTRKSRPRIKEKEEKEAKGGYCEICNAEYADAALHRRSPHHLAFVRDHTNFLSLDSLIDASADVTTFLDKAAAPVNGERRSLRKICNGDADSPKNNNKRSKRSQSPDSTVNGHASPRRNGQLDDDRRHNTRCSKRISDQASEDRQYYKVVGVSTKLRSSGGVSARQRDSPACNGAAKPLVVKFRKIRKSELSVLSDEAEQFMFPRRPSESSDASSDDDDDKKSKQQQPPAPALERRRLARPLALKEESSEEDSWPEEKGRRKRRVPAVARRSRRASVPVIAAPVEPPAEPEPEPAAAVAAAEAGGEEVSPLRSEALERCMRWEEGRLKYTPAVEQLEFAFESVPRSEPWFETFKRQDEDKVVAKNVPHYFSLYATKATKLPYEIGQLPPLKPNCCPLSALVKREERGGAARYGTRGTQRDVCRKRAPPAVAAAQAHDAHPRKSPREHASTLAILGSAGFLHRRRHGDDAKSTASEDTASDTHSNHKVEPAVSEAQEASERLQQFLSEVFEDAEEYDVSEEVMDSETVVTTSTNVPDVLSLVSECEGCEIIRDEIRDGAATVARPKSRRGKFKKKNRTGWPAKKKVKKESSGANSPETKDESSVDGSAAEREGESSRDSASEDEPAAAASDQADSSRDSHAAADADESQAKTEDEDSDDKPLKLDVKVLVQDDEKKSGELEEKRASRSSASEGEEREERARGAKKKRSALEGLLLQPVVRVARVDPAAARRLRSAARPPRPARLR